MRLSEIWPGVDEKERRRILRSFPKFNTLFIVKDKAGNILDWDADHFGVTIPAYIGLHAPPEWDFIEVYAWLPGANFVKLPSVPRGIAPQQLQALVLIIVAQAKRALGL